MAETSNGNSDGMMSGQGGGKKIPTPPPPPQILVNRPVRQQVDSIENRRDVDDEVLQDQPKDLDLMEHDEFLQVSTEQRQRAVTSCIHNIRAQTKFSVHQCHILLQPLLKYAESMQKEVKNRVMNSILVKQEKESLEKEFLNLQRNEQPATTSHNQVQMDARSALMNAQKELRKAEGDLMQLDREKINMNFEMRKYEEENEVLKQQVQWLRQNQTSGMHSRVAEHEGVKKDNHIRFQYMERNRSPPWTTSTPRQIFRSGNYQYTPVMREAPREYCEETQEILESSRASNTFDSNKLSHNRNNTKGINNEYCDKEIYERMERSMPEPPRFSAENPAVDLDTFEEMFRLKYGRFQLQFQRNLLQTKFLVGKALKVYKSLRQSEKESLDEIMESLRRRLKGSGADKAYRAKFQFDEIKMQKDQSIEDFCLKVDEVARVAFEGVEDEQLASIKVAKVVKELMVNGNFSHMIHMIESQLQQVPLEDHYETFREQAIRYEVSHCEQMKLKGLSKPEQGEKRRQNTNVYTPHVQQKYQTSSRKSSSRYHNENFDSSPDYNSRGNDQNFNEYENTSRNWQDYTQKQTHKSSDESELGFRKCIECQQSGCHDPNCSRAPGAMKQDRMRSVTCFHCNEKGHYAPSCPQKKQQAPSDNDNIPPAVSTVEKKLTDKVTIPINGIVKGYIGNAEVKIMLDSGACTSLISSKVWNELVCRNGITWEQKSIVKNPQMFEVVAANQTPINLLFQAKVVTKMLSSSNILDFFVDEGNRDYIILGRDQFDTIGVRVDIVHNKATAETMCSENLKSDQELVDYKSDCFLLNEGQCFAVKGVGNMWHNGDDHSKGPECSRTLCAHEENVSYGGDIRSKGREGARTSYSHVEEMKTSGVDVNSTISSTSDNQKHSGGYPNDISRTLMAKKEKQQIVPIKKNSHVVIDGFKSLNDVQDEQMTRQCLRMSDARKEITSMSFFPHTNESKKEDRTVKPVSDHTPSTPDKPGLEKKGDVTCGGFSKKKERYNKKDIPVNWNHTSSCITDDFIRPLKDPPYSGNLTETLSPNYDFQVNCCDNMRSRKNLVNVPTQLMLVHETSTIDPKTMNSQKDSKDSPTSNQLWRTLCIKPREFSNAMFQESGANFTFKPYFMDQ